MLDHLVAFRISWSEPGRNQIVRPAELIFMRQNPFEIANETISVGKWMKGQPSLTALEVTLLVCHVLIRGKRLAIDS
jgi:hypothetical protein